MSAARRLINVETFREQARSGRAVSGGVVRTAPGKPQAGDESSRTIRFVFSDESVDLEYDVITAAGWDLSIFARNPVILFGHDDSRPDNVVGRALNVGVEGRALMGSVTFADRDTNPTADTVYRLYKGGFLNAVSVGFEPVEYEFTTDAARPGGIDFKRSRLLEVSCVPIPCNSNALAVARSKGIDTAPLVRWADQALDRGAVLPFKREVIEAVRKQAGAPGVYRAGSSGRRETVAQNAARHGIVLRSGGGKSRTAPRDWPEALEAGYSNSHLSAFIRSGMLPNPIGMKHHGVVARYGTPVLVEMQRRGLIGL